MARSFRHPYSSHGKKKATNRYLNRTLVGPNNKKIAQEDYAIHHYTINAHTVYAVVHNADVTSFLVHNRRPQVLSVTSGEQSYPFGGAVQAFTRDPEATNFIIAITWAMDNAGTATGTVFYLYGVYADTSFDVLTPTATYQGDADGRNVISYYVVPANDYVEFDMLAIKAAAHNVGYMLAYSIFQVKGCKVDSPVITHAGGNSSAVSTVISAQAALVKANLSIAAFCSPNFSTDNEAVTTEGTIANITNAHSYVRYGVPSRKLEFTTGSGGLNAAYAILSLEGEGFVGESLDIPIIAYAASITTINIVKSSLVPTLVSINTQDEADLLASNGIYVYGAAGANVAVTYVLLRATGGANSSVVVPTYSRWDTVLSDYVVQAAPIEYSTPDNSAYLFILIAAETGSLIVDGTLTFLIDSATPVDADWKVGKITNRYHVDDTGALVADYTGGAGDTVDSTFSINTPSVSGPLSSAAIGPGTSTGYIGGDVVYSYGSTTYLEASYDRTTNTANFDVTDGPLPLAYGMVTLSIAPAAGDTPFVITSLSYSVTRQNVNDIYNKVLTVTNLAYSEALQSSGLIHGYPLIVSSKSFALALQTVGMLLPKKITTDSLAFIQTETGLIVALGRKTLVPNLAYAEALQTVGTKRGYVIRASNLSFALTGTEVGIYPPKRLIVTNLAYAKTLSTVNLARAYTSLSVAIVYLQALSAVLIKRTYVLRVASLSYATARTDLPVVQNTALINPTTSFALVVHSGIKVDRVLSSSNKAFAVNGTNVLLKVSLAILAPSVDISLTHTAFLRKDYILEVDTLAFSESLTGVILARARFLIVENDAINLSVTFNRLKYSGKPGTHYLFPESNTYVLARTDVGVVKGKTWLIQSLAFFEVIRLIKIKAGRKVIADEGSYTLALQDPVFAKNTTKGWQIDSLAFNVGFTNVEIDAPAWWVVGSVAYAVNRQAVEWGLLPEIVAANQDYETALQNVPMIYSGLAAYVIQATSLSFSVVGQDTTVDINFIIIVPSLAYKLNKVPYVIEAEPRWSPMAARRGGNHVSGRTVNG